MISRAGAIFFGSLLMIGVSSCSRSQERDGEKSANKQSVSREQLSARWAETTLAEGACAIDGNTTVQFSLEVPTIIDSGFSQYYYPDIVGFPEYYGETFSSGLYKAQDTISPIFSIGPEDSLMSITVLVLRANGISIDQNYLDERLEYHTISGKETGSPDKLEKAELVEINGHTFCITASYHDWDPDSSFSGSASAVINGYLVNVLMMGQRVSCGGMLEALVNSVETFALR